MGTDSTTVMDRADALARFSEEPGRITRRYGTPALIEARAAVADWMRAAGMDVRIDAIGNLVGRYPTASDGAPTLLLGSHLDSVPDAGRYDGILGVLIVLAAIERLHRDGTRLPYALELYGFADEEGARFNTAYLGSSAVAGTLDPAALDRRDADLVPLTDAIRASGGNPDALAEARRSPDGLLGYLEVHIEQGPVLEAHDQPLGVVEAINGQTRGSICINGAVGHAGTVPMVLRRDALCAAAEVVLELERIARRTDGLVATVGRISVRPNGSNVIPGDVTISIDIRHRDDGVRTDAWHSILARTREIARERRLEATEEELLDHPSVQCSSHLSDLLHATATAAAGDGVMRLTSGAGHDAAAIAEIAPIAMLFIRCAEGVSHDPAEKVERRDVELATDTVVGFLSQLAHAITTNGST